MLLSVLIIGSLVKSAAVPLQEHTISYDIQLLQAFKNSINTHDHYNLGKTEYPKWKCDKQKHPHKIASDWKALERYGSIIGRNEL